MTPQDIWKETEALVNSLCYVAETHLSFLYFNLKLTDWPAIITQNLTRLILKPVITHDS